MSGVGGDAAVVERPQAAARYGQALLSPCAHPIAIKIGNHKANGAPIRVHDAIRPRLTEIRLRASQASAKTTLIHTAKAGPTMDAELNRTGEATAAIIAAGTLQGRLAVGILLKLSSDRIVRNPPRSVARHVRFWASRHRGLSTQSDGVDAPRRHRSARVEVFEHHCEGGVRGRRYHRWA